MFQKGEGEDTFRVLPQVPLGKVWNPPRPCNELVTPPASCLKACGLGSSTPSTPTPAALQGKSGQTLDEWTFMISKQSHLHLF